MKHLWAFFYNNVFTDEEIVDMLRGGDAKRVRAAEDFLYRTFYQWISQKPFTEILKDKRDREEAYSDANMYAISNIKAGVFEGKSALNTYCYKIYYYTCVTFVRRNATKKKSPDSLRSQPSDQLIQGLSADVQHTLLGRMMQQAASLMDRALQEFRHTNYRCYYILALYDCAGFSYEEILALGGKPGYELENGSIFQPEELGGVEKIPLQLDAATPNALKALASRCRNELRTLIERLKKST